MKAFGEDLIHLRELFSADTDDVRWLHHIGKNQMFLITRDERIRRRPAELKALREYEIGAFFLGGKNRSRCELIQQLVRNWPRIKEYARTTRRPFAFRVPSRGTKFDPISIA